jgi:hypothetical protein
VLLQDADDLLFREAAAPHVLVLSMGQNELQAGLSQRGNVIDCSKNHHILEPIGNIQPAEAEERYYASSVQSAMAA